MPDQTPTLDIPDPEAMAAPDATPKPSLMGKLSILCILLAVVGAECVAAYFLAPNVTSMAVSPEDNPKEATEEGDEFDFLPDTESGLAFEDCEEVDLGEFRITQYQPGSNTTMRIDFYLYGTVHTDDKEDFEEAMVKCQHRVRSGVIATLRGAESVDLTDPLLGLIKRRVLEKINRTLGKPYLREVLLSEFSYVEQ